MGRDPWTRRRVLALGCDARSFLAVVRSLSRAGLEVHGAWHERHSPAFRSRHLAAFHPLPKFNERPESWKPELLALLERGDFDLVLPTNDPALIALHGCRAELARFRGVHLPAERVVAVAFDKLATWELARELGIPVPRQRRVRSADEARGLVEELGLPLVLKPRRSFAFERRKWEHQVRRVSATDALETSLAALLETGEVLAQEAVAGRGVGLELLAEQGECRMAFQHLRLHEPLHGGGSSYRVSEPLDARLLAAASGLARAIGLHGLAMFEFKRGADGSFHLIEINARCWGSLPLAVAAGADFPRALAELVLDGRSPRQPAYRVPLYARNLPMDFGWFLRNLAADRRDGRLLTVSLPRLAAELAHPLLGRERIDSLARDDRGPFWQELRGVVRDSAALARGRAVWLGSRIGLVRRRAAARARAQLARARSVLFVCTGNLCRSPFAEHFARRAFGGRIECGSAGLRAEPGRSPPAELLRCAAEHGLELGGHRARGLDAGELAAADLVFVFDRKQRRALRTLAPAIAGRIHLLGALAAPGPLEITDPYGRDLGAFRSTCAAIARALDGSRAEART